MVLRYCLGMIASVSTLIVFSGAATPSTTVNFSIARSPNADFGCGDGRLAGLRQAAVTGWRGAQVGCATASEPFQHDLTARLSALQEDVRPLEVFGVDHAKMLRHR